MQRAREEVLARQDAERTSTRQAAALDELSTEVRTAVESIRRIMEAADQQHAGASRDIFLDAVRVVTETLAARAGVAHEPS